MTEPHHPQPRPDSLPSHESPRAVGSLLIVGCGRLGTALGRLVLADGGAVIGIRRNPGNLPEAFTTIAADVTQPLDIALPPIDSIVFTLPPGSRATGPDDDTYQRALANVDSALAARPSRVVFVSSTRVFEGAAASQTIDEGSQPAPRSERAESLLAGERLAVELFGAHVIRPAGIYGDGRNSLTERVRVGEELDGNRLTNRIHQDDLARGIYTVLRSPSPPPLLHATDDHPAPLRDVATFIAATLGVDPPPFADATDVSGRRMSGALFRATVGGLTYPDYRAGYSHILGDLSA
ncbi:sugar nucleotide-binding protein [Microbacterium sp. C448]|uniref:sugar nucleotide-binding protein n=1 Tax=Microbacterium sp. C448 TaxID=1177594 RepID=UPI0004B0DE17|nr:sugar nucleotide-binding protein [Microbacterium sp. C448]